ncbi:hypothetical protein HF872_11000 [Megasphaera hexanoica]|uniref:Uncharacterized protein n=1 Tax=Megasphaera hexanoica TaxID=1675036 RepID=A0A848BV77_9FIRM|nr:MULTISPECIES: hypothetical protein [Megasphaera]NME29140.1 hypothetical protein [Megasphaera hexanoica]
MTEQTRKMIALGRFEQALAAGGKYFQLKLINDETVEVTDLESQAVKHVNIACDNVPAMLFDILRQAADWMM